MNSARKAASSASKDLGASVAQQRMAGAKGMFAAASTDLKDKVRSVPETTSSTEAEKQFPVAELRHTSAADRIHPANSDQKIQEP